MGVCQYRLERARLSAVAKGLRDGRKKLWEGLEKVVVAIYKEYVKCLIILIPMTCIHTIYIIYIGAVGRVREGCLLHPPYHSNLRSGQIVANLHTLIHLQLTT